MIRNDDMSAECPRYKRQDMPFLALFCMNNRGTVAVLRAIPCSPKAEVTSSNLVGCAIFQYVSFFSEGLPLPSPSRA
ncbi:hypothetical protein AQ1_01435 [alpha proteobacterium Q-1]|nr:hypothetical protein AQ1_01435 [alpha proteobacterium Q-1]